MNRSTNYVYNVNEFMYVYTCICTSVNVFCKLFTRVKDICFSSWSDNNSEGRLALVYGCMNCEYFIQSTIGMKKSSYISNGKKVLSLFIYNLHKTSITLNNKTVIEIYVIFLFDQSNE